MWKSQTCGEIRGFISPQRHHRHGLPHELNFQPQANNRSHQHHDIRMHSSSPESKTHLKTHRKVVTRADGLRSSPVAKNRYRSIRQHLKYGIGPKQSLSSTVPDFEAVILGIAYIRACIHVHGGLGSSKAGWRRGR